MLESLFATLAAKIAAGGLVVAIGATGGLAGNGNLPDRAQSAVSDALSNIGIDIPSGDTVDEVVESALEKIQVASDIVEDFAEVVEEENGEEGDTEEPNENAAFGQSVAADARDGGVDGQQISERAKAMAAERRAAGQANRPENAGPPAGTGSDENEATSAEAGAHVGLEAAANTPAAGFIPGNVPGGPGTADQYRPAGTPGRR
ncbi:hypothetical protein BH23ACT12_BH23ACT12_22900 [soil metagenome]